MWTQFWSGARFGSEQSKALLDELWDDSDDAVIKVMSQFNAREVCKEVFVEPILAVLI